MYVKRGKKERLSSTEIVRIENVTGVDQKRLVLFSGGESHPSKLFLDGNITMEKSTPHMETSIVTVEVFFEAKYGKEVEYGKLMMMPVIMKKRQGVRPFQYQIQESIYVNRMRKGVPDEWVITMYVKFNPLPCHFNLQFSKTLVVMDRQYLEFGMRKYERNLQRTERKETYTMGSILTDKVRTQKARRYRKKYNLYRYKRDFNALNLAANDEIEYSVFYATEKNTKFKNITLYMSSLVSGNITLELYVRRNKVIPIGESKTEEFITDVMLSTFTVKERQTFKKIKTPGLILTPGDSIVLLSSTSGIKEANLNHLKCVLCFYHTSEVIERDGVTSTTSNIIEMQGRGGESYSSSTGGIKIVRV